MTEVNVPLLRKAVEWVEEQEKLPAETREWMQTEIILPEEYRIRWHGHTQGCGSAFCVAGYIAHMVTGTEDWAGAINIAEEALGLEHQLGHNLFRGHNTAADIRRIAEGLAGQPL